MKSHTLLLGFALLTPIVSSATWSVEEAPSDMPSRCSHVITDGNWRIGVYRYGANNWRLGKNDNGSAYIAGEGVLDLRTLEEDCGVILKSSSNGGLERVTTITEVYFPDCFESMEGATFNSDSTGVKSQLRKVVFGPNLKKIGDKAFYNCRNLESVNFPEGLESIGYQSFTSCTSFVLQEEGFPESLTTLGHNCFANCESLVTGTHNQKLNLKNVSIANGTYHFEKNKNITEVVALNLKSIPSGMFSNCSGLKVASFSPDVSSIGESAFNGTALTTFSPTVLPKFTAIGYAAFRGLKQLSGKFDFSRSKLETVPQYALVDLEKVAEIDFPATLKELGQESLAYNRATRVVRFASPPPTMASSALNPVSGSPWYLVVSSKVVNDWKNDEHFQEFTDNDKASNSYPGRDDIKAKWGLANTLPIGTWAYQTGSAKHYILEELPSGTLIVIR